MSCYRNASQSLDILKVLFLVILSLLLAVACRVEDEPAQSTGVLVATSAVESIPTSTPKPATPTIQAEKATPTETLPAPTEEPTRQEPSPTATTPPDTPLPTDSPVNRPASAIQLSPVAAGFQQPVYLTHAGDERLFIVEKQGTIRIIQDGQVIPDPFLDISDKVRSIGYEQGLLSVAFHPDYPDNGDFFVNYNDLEGATIIAQYQRDAEDPDRADPESERILLRIEQPYNNHNGGLLKFGPDNYLYIGMGDGGSAGDPQMNAQDATTLLGSILRIEVDGADPYAIPPDNPFIDSVSMRDEIWAIGLRNPWRFSFDRLTDDLYIADVGQSAWEEINFHPAGSSPGQNYGWNIMEGSHCYNQESCDSEDFVLPIGEYFHEAGNCSVTGGYIYRGAITPQMTGNYIFGDFCSGRIWRLFLMENGDWAQEQIGDMEFLISSFGEDFSGELYILDMMGGGIYLVQLS